MDIDNKKLNENKISSGGSRAIKDCLAGTVAGSFQVLTGQPFDTIKVRLQAPSIHNPYTGLLNCISRTFKEEGLIGFYKGTMTPLLGVGLCVSIQFVVMEHMKRVLDKDNLTMGKFYFAGATSGLANCIAASPIELIRTRLQLNNTSHQSPIKLIQTIFNTQGIRGLYSGLVPTILRDTQAYGMYFMIYESLVQYHLNSTSSLRKDIPSHYTASYGILSGFGYWLSCYPIDVIKTKIQANPNKSMGVLNCFNQIYQQNGIRGFFKGLLPCLLRTIPAASSTFLGFELAMRYLD